MPSLILSIAERICAEAPHTRCLAVDWSSDTAATLEEIRAFLRAHS